MNLDTGGCLSNPEDISIQVLTFYLQAHATMILAQNRWVSKGKGGLMNTGKGEGVQSRVHDTQTNLGSPEISTNPRYIS